MSINPLDTVVPTTVFPGAAAGMKSRTGGSSFASLLGSLQNADDSSATAQAEADLLRMEMMQSSLSLFGGEERGQASGVQALESLIASLAGGSSAGSRRVGGAIGAGPTAKAGASARSNSGVMGSLGIGGNGGDEGQVASRPVGDVSLLNELIEAGGGSSSMADGIEKTAEGFLGTPYRFGGEGPAGIDCSSFVQQVFREHQINLPRTAREQSQMGTDVAPADLKKGDLIFFHTYASYPSHVGIYLGDGKMIHASSARGEVTVSDINSNYYRTHFIGAKRLA